MANERIGRLDSYGFAAESTKGTAEGSPDFWYPRVSGVIEDMYEKDIVESAMGTISKNNLQRTVKSWSEGSFEGLIEDNKIGWLLGAVMGAYPSVSAVESGVADHEFTVSNTNNHQSLTIFKREGSIGTRKFSMCCVENFSINYVKDQILRFSMDVKGKASASDTDTVSIDTGNVFVPAMFTFKVANIASTTAGTQSALTNAAELVVRDANLNIAKNLIIEWNDGVPTGIYNGPFEVSGDFTLLHTDATYHDIVAANTNKALRFGLLHTTLIGAASYPTLNFDVLSAILESYDKSEDLDDMSLQTIGFQGMYSTDCAETLVATLRNTRDIDYSGASSPSPSQSPSASLSPSISPSVSPSA